MQARNLYMAAGLAATLSLAATFNAYAKNIPDQEFVTKASIGNQFEIASSQLALEKSQDNSIRGFAQVMIDDHTKAKGALADTLQSSSSDAKPANGLDEEHTKLIEELKSANENFDQKYVNMQHRAHKQAVRLFDNYAENGKDAALQSFAAATLPTLREHLKHVQQLK